MVGIVDEVARPVQPELERYLRRALMLLRWITLAALLAIVVMQPAVGYRRLPMWALVALFAGYSLVVDLLSLRVARSRPLVATAVLTLPAAAGLYALRAEPGGVLFVLFFLAVDYAAASMSPRGTLLYVVAAVLCAAAIDPLLPRWGHTMADVRLLAARLVILALVGAGMVILTRRLALEHEASRITRDEAERLEALDRLRADFVASVSHDLRTPLTAVRAGLGMLETGIGERLPPEERQLLSDARLNVERLRRLIDDLLAYNQLEAGAVRLDRELLDLRAVARDAASAVHTLIDEKGQVLEVDLPAPLPVAGDAQRLAQVVMNLLSNAHEHTPPGARIILSGYAQGREALLLVCDTGPGVPVAELERIFDRFHRVGRGGNGSGLGLAIAKGIVELHGGRIWAESAPDQGVTFHVALPRHDAGTPA